MAESGNNVTIIGTLVDNQLSKGVSKDGREYINGFIVVSDGTNRVQVNCMAMSKTNSGNDNPSYRELQNVMNNGAVADEANNVAGSLIKIASNGSSRNGSLENSDYYDQNGALVKNVRVRASFPRIVDKLGPKERMCAQFSFTGYISSIIEEIKNDEQTGRLNVTLTGINYNGSTNPIPIIIAKEHAPNFAAMFQPGQTVTIDGNIVNILETKTIETPVSWGQSIPKTQTTVIREFIAVGGSQPFDENDPLRITTEEVREGDAKREQILQQNKKNAEERAKAKQAQASVATGFGGNANVYAASVTPTMPTAGRPIF